MITPGNWEHIRALFHDALDRSPDERAELLGSAHGADDEIRREVLALLDAHASASGFLSGSATDALAATAAAATTPALTPGSRLGPFEILGPLGAGGMGEVHRARDTRLDRIVAIKVLSRELAKDPHGRDRFEREARLVSKLSHPHICTLHDIGSASLDGSEVQFLVMELLDGETLAARLKRGPLPVTQALHVAHQIAQALAAAHALGIVHRDLKPANIMLTSSGVKLLDFGLARLRSSTDLGPDDRLTVEGVVLGTIPYMAPEQVRGEDADARADLFAFGTVVYEMVTGRRAFRGDSEAELIAAILERDPPPVTTIQPVAPAALNGLVAGCLAKDREKRWQHAQDLGLALDGISRGDAQGDPAPLAGALPAPASEFAARRGRRVHALWAVIAAAVGVSAWLLSTAVTGAVPPANPRPVIVLMDSPLAGRVYDARTLAEGGTNADDITDALRGLDLVTHKENTSPIWHREEQVREQSPDLIISHLSCLYDERAAKGDTETARHLFDMAEMRLTAFFGYLGTTNPRTRFLVYSRGRFVSAEAGDKWAAEIVARFPGLKGRVFGMIIPGRERATFRDPATAELLRERVRTILDAPAR